MPVLKYSNVFSLKSCLNLYLFIDMLSFYYYKAIIGYIHFIAIALLAKNNQTPV